MLDKPVKGKKKRTIEEFYIQSAEDSRNAGVPFSVLILKKDRRDPVIMLPYEIFTEIEEYDPPFLYYSGGGTLPEYAMLNMNEFIENIDFKTFHKACKKASMGHTEHTKHYE